MDQLSRLSTSSSIHASLNALPRGLHGTYNRILQGVPPEHIVDAVWALRWLSYAAVPLNLDELVEAIAINENSSCLSDLETLSDPEHIFEICGSLIRLSKPTGLLSLAHSSVHEYLTGAHEQMRPPAMFQLNKASSSIELAKKCLKYLSFQDFNMTAVQSMLARMDPSVSPTLSIPDEGFAPAPAFFDYATRYWWRHLPADKEDIDAIWPYAAQFFNSEGDNFEALIMLRHRMESSYRYPLAMQPIHFLATHGLAAIIDYMLNKSAVDVRLRVEDGRTALHMGIENGHEMVVHRLLANGADPDAATADGRNPLQLALESGNVAITERLLEAGAEVNITFANEGTPLSVAIENNATSLVQVLLHWKADARQRLRGERTPLHLAAAVGCDPEIFALLFQNGADPTAGDDGLWTPLHYAADGGHGQAVQLLMDRRNVNNIFREGGWSPLHAAVEQQHTGIIRLFIEYAKGISERSFGRSQRQRPTSRVNPKYLAAKIARISAGKPQGTPNSSLDPYMTSSSGGSFSPGAAKHDVPTPLYLATSQNYMDGIHILMEGGVAWKDQEDSIRLALSKGYMNALERLVFNCAKDFEASMDFIQALMMGGEVRLPLRSLFESFNWNKTNIPIALQYIVQESSHDLVGEKSDELLGYLIQRLSTLDRRSQVYVEGQLMDVLQVAVKCGSSRAVTILREIPGVNFSRTFTAMLCPWTELYPNDPRPLLCSLLHLAASNQDTDILELMVKSVDPNIVDGEGRTPLHYAAHHCNEKAITILLRAGAQVDFRDISRHTPLHICALSRSRFDGYPSPTISALLNAGASKMALNEAGFTPFQLALYEAIESRASDKLADLLEYQPQLIDTRLPPVERTALHIAAEVDCGFDILEILLHKGADIEAKDKDGMTPLDVAGENAKKILINHGACENY